MLDGYDALISTAIQISELIKPVEKEYFQKFNLTWECFNKTLYQDYVYTDPLIQNKLPPFISQVNVIRLVFCILFLRKKYLMNVQFFMSCKVEEVATFKGYRISRPCS